MKRPPKKQKLGGFSSFKRAVSGRHSALVLLLLPILVSFAWVLRVPSYLIGDGREYICVARSWAQTLRPFASEGFLKSCVAELVPGDVTPLTGFIKVGGWWDSVHFWLLPLLVAPFHWLTVLLRLPAASSYTLFHCALSLLVAVRIIQRLGPLRAFAIGLLYATSPIVYWSNKWHGEFFVCGLLVLAFVEIAVGDLVWAAFWTAIASCQQPTLAVPSVLMIAGAIAFRSRLQATAHSTPVFFGTLAFLALAPLYNLWRYGKIAAVAEANDPHLIGFHRAFALLVDPDIGLAWAWPMCLPLMVVVFVGLLSKQANASVKRLAVITALFCTVEWLLVSAHPNYNSGATIDVMRHALYGIPPLIVTAVQALGSLLSGRSALVQRGVVVAASLGVIIYGAQWNERKFSPGYVQNYLFRTPAAEWLYSHYPQLYDPVPEIYMERATHHDGMNPNNLDPGVWAVGNAACNKLLILADANRLRKLDDPVSPAGCLLPNDSLDVLRELRAGTLVPNARGYVNRPNI